jgi:hypothetical protein
MIALSVSFGTKITGGHKNITISVGYVMLHSEPLKDLQLIIIYAWRSTVTLECV